MYGGFEKRSIREPPFHEDRTRYHQKGSSTRKQHFKERNTNGIQREEYERHINRKYTTKSNVLGKINSTTNKGAPYEIRLPQYNKENSNIRKGTKEQQANINKENRENIQVIHRITFTKDNQYVIELPSMNKRKNKIYD